MPRGIPDGQRAALRRFYAKEVEQGQVSQQKCIDWFQKEFGRRLNQSTVSESLGAKWAYLDGVE
ncbi:MAG: hypothetical protein M1823_005900, partial [Watsoniomyces obsoletus]